MDDPYIFYFFFEAARFAASRKTSEACATRSQCPAWNRNIKCGKFLYNIIYIRYPFSNKFILALMICQLLMIEFIYLMFFQPHILFMIRKFILSGTYRTNAVAKPPSTFNTLPVDLFNKPPAK